MEQKEPVLVLYDREEEYARLFSEYLKRQKELPWQIHTYTRAEELLAGEKSGEVTMLVVCQEQFLILMFQRSVLLQALIWKIQKITECIIQYMMK